MTNACKITWRLENNDRKLEPLKKHKADAGFDVCSNEDITIPARSWKLVKTGVFASIPFGFEIQVRPRSGLAFKNGISVVNAPGTVDSGYQDEIGILLMNNSDKDFKVSKYDRIAQFVVSIVPTVYASVRDFNYKDASSERGLGGFGSTGVK